MTKTNPSNSTAPQSAAMPLEPLATPAPRGTTTLTTPPAQRTAEPNAEIYTIYLREIGRVPLLTAAEETALAHRARQGDRAAREQMITANLRLVVKIAREWEGFGLPLLDLISEGNIGLMKGVERYDPAKGARLGSYAAWWIKQSIRRAIYNQVRTIRLPVPVAEKLLRLRRVAAQLEKDLGHEPSDWELAEEMKMPPNKVVRLRVAAQHTVSLDAQLHEDHGDTLAAHLSDDRVQTPAEELEACGDAEFLRAARSALTPREQLVLNRRFGLDEGEEHTLDEVAVLLKLTPERIRQIQNEAIVKLRRGFARFEMAGVAES